MSKFSKQKNSGFTLVETLVAISILSLSILATFTAVQGGLQSSSAAKDQIIAYYFAQEAMEYIKNVRDENAIKSLGGTTVHWLSGLSELNGNPCYFGKTCTIDSAQTAVANCASGAGTCPRLNQQTSTGLHGYTSGSGWVTTNFRREIQFTSISSNEVRATITVTWTTRGVPKTFQVSQLLFNR